MIEPAYSAARAVAAQVRQHFLQHVAAARACGIAVTGPEPDVGTIEAMIDAAFWASLRREEGVTPKISLAWLPPSQAATPLTFAMKLPLRPAPLARLAPAVERPGIHLGVWAEDGELRVWGTTRDVPAFCLVVEVITSGLIVVKHRTDPFGKFTNVAVLEGDQVKIVDEGFSRTPDCPGPVKSLLGFDAPQAGTGSIDVLVQLAASMRAHGRGGALLVVPEGTSAWQESIVSPALYTVDPPYTGLSDLVTRGDEATSHEWQEALRRAVDALAGLTAVDGATVITDRYALMTFGAKITRRRGNPPVEKVVVTEPVQGAATTIATPVQLGGTRHLSAAQFIQDQRDSIALVASQDGRFTIFKWSPTEDMVHAHRVEALLL